MVRVVATSALAIAIAVHRPRPCRAEPTTPQLTVAMADYFAGEIRGGIALLAMGGGALAVGIPLIAGSDGVARGIGFPLVGFGVAHVAAGVYVAVASLVRRRVNFTAIAHGDATAWATAERTRMRGVATQFTVLKVVELALIVGGVGFGLAEHRDHRQRAGVGYGIALEAGATLVFDIIAARRAAHYRKRIAIEGSQLGGRSPVIGGGHDVSGKWVPMIGVGWAL